VFTFFPRAAVFCCEGTAGNLDDLGFGAVVLIPGDNSCIYHALDYDGANIGANAFRQSTADFFSDQPEYVIENMPLEDRVRWDSNKTPVAYKADRI
jgi:hypothetical protein